MPKLYCTIFICAKKESGKTNTIFKILKECSTKKSELNFISSTIFNDDNWIKICEYFENKGNTVNKYTTLEEANLKAVTNELENAAKKEIEDKKKPKTEKPKKLILFEDEEDEKKFRKDKKISPEIIFVFDDLSSELRDKEISTLIKKHRHFKTKIILSSQYPNDLAPESRKNIDFWILFAGHSEDKLFTIFQNCDLNISFDLFQQLYKDATKKPYSFLFVDKNKNEFRRNFNLLYQIQS